MQTRLKKLAVIGMLMCLVGCATKTVTVIDTSSDIVRLDADVRAKVSTYQGNGVWTSAGSMVMPKGWVCGPMPPLKK